MLKILILSLFLVSTSYAQDNSEKYVVKKDKNGKPLPVCAPDQKSTEEKPCRRFTMSQQAGAGSRF